MTLSLGLRLLQTSGMIIDFSFKFTITVFKLNYKSNSYGQRRVHTEAEGGGLQAVGAGVHH